MQTLQENGSPEVPEVPQVETPEIQHDETPINTVGQALEAFDLELNPQPTVEQPQAVQPTARKFDGLEPEEVDYFKRMSNSAYNKLYPEYLAYKKLKTEHEQLQQQFKEAQALPMYAQENAWKLAPEYNELAQNAQQLSAEINHWQEQLANVEAGQPWRGLVMDPQGNIVKGPEQEASPQGKAEILSKISQGYTLQQSVQAQMSQFDQQYKERHQSFLGKLQEIDKQVFAGVDPAKLAERARPKLELFPPAFRGQPMTQMLAKALVVIEGLIAMNRAARNATTNQQIKTRTATNAGPPVSSIQSGSDKSTTAGAIFDEFRRARLSGVA